MKYLEQYKQLHQQKRGYGATGESLAGLIYRQLLKIKPESIIDYGCGKSELINLLRYKDGVVLKKYDPAIPGIDTLPEDIFDLLVSTDVMEHIPEEELHDSIIRIKSISEKAIFAISLRESGNVLPDGTPCHVTVKPMEWWIKLLKIYYHEVELIKLYKDKVVLLCSE